MVRTAVFSFKGGVGKSVISSNLAVANVLRYKEPTLIVDFDGQANTTSTFMNPIDAKYGIADVLLGRKKLHEVVLPVSGIDNLYLVPSTLELNELDLFFFNNYKKYEKKLYSLLAGMDTSEFSSCYYDLPPSMGIISNNALSVADVVHVPYVPEPYSTFGLFGVIRMIMDVQVTNHNLKLGGVIVNKYDSRLKNLHVPELAEMLDFCDRKGFHVFDTIIKSHSKIPQALRQHQTPAVMAASFDKAYDTEQINDFYKLLEEMR